MSNVVEVVDIQENDVVLLKADQRLTAQDRESMVKMWKEAMANPRVIPVIDSSFRIVVIRKKKPVGIHLEKYCNSPYCGCREINGEEEYSRIYQS